MSARTFDGRAVAAAVLADVRAEVEAMEVAPQLVFVRASDDPAGASYVRSKGKRAGTAGVRHETRVVPEDATNDDLQAVLQDLNDDPDVDGILVQLPLYLHLDADAALRAIAPEKDVDALHPVNVGRLWRGRAAWAPATPAGLLRILDHYEVPLEGREVVVVGRSDLVGKPAAALFLGRNATVTVAHSRTRDLAAVTRRADVLVAAAGVPGMITPEHVQAGAVVLDVGQAPVDGVLRGDVAPDVARVAGALTPTPGGTGPMTVAMVVANTVRAARARRGTA